MFLLSKISPLKPGNLVNPVQNFFRLKSLLLLFLLGTGIACAQTPIPAQPVDPNQPMPAQPIEPVTPSAPPAVPNPADAGPNVSVLADSSLKNVLQDLAQAWADTQSDSPRMPITLTNAATMRSQLQSNPAWDVVMDADLDDVKALTDQGLLSAEGQRSLARNTVVVYGRSPLVKEDAPDWFDLVGGEWKKVALGNPDLTASGRVARHALQKHNLFGDDQKGLYALAGTETLALQTVERDQADAVFVYRTDLANVSVPGFEVMALGSDDAPPVFYTAAMGRLAKDPVRASAFIEFCASDAARPIWTKYGFELN
jgi:molybdate transport system substrate-binding protein